MRFRDMFRRKEFFFTGLILLVLFLLPAFIDILRLYGNDLSTVRPPWYYFGLSLSLMWDYCSPSVLSAVCLVAIPLFSSMAYSYCCFDESKYGIKNILIAKSSRSHYYLSSAFAVFIGGFFVVLFPMILNQLVFLAAVPNTAYASVQAGAPDFLDITYRNITYFSDLANNHHNLFNLLYCFIPSLVCALLGLFSFSISLLFRFNKFLIITIPLIIYLVCGYVLGQFGDYHNWVVQYIIMPAYYHKGLKLSHLIIVIAGLILFNSGALLYKIRYARNEL
jgi:hypothetical protein